LDDLYGEIAGFFRESVDSGDFTVIITLAARENEYGELSESAGVITRNGRVAPAGGVGGFFDNSVDRKSCQ
jgi:hypothetical protein